MIWDNIHLYFTLGFLFVGFLMQLLKRFYAKNITIRHFKILFLSGVLFVIIYYAVLVFFQYKIWANGGEPLSFLVPPYRSMWYVIGYHFTRFAMYYVISLVASILFFISSIKYNNKFQNRFFENEEPYLGALSLFLLGNGEWFYLWIFYLIAILIISVFGSYILQFLFKKNERFQLYWLWMPVALIGIIIMRIIL